MTDKHKKGSILGRIGQYLDALDNTGRILTLASILPAISDIIAPYLGYEISIPLWAHTLWFFLAFGIANLRVFEASSSEGIQIQLTRHQVTLEKWLFAGGQKFSINNQICIKINGDLSISNMEGMPTSVRIVLNSFESELNPSIDVKTINIHVDKFDTRGMAHTGNPFNIGPHEMIDRINFQCEIPIQIPEQEDPFTHLGSLNSLKFEIAAARAGKKSYSAQFEGDVKAIRMGIEQQLIQKVQHSQRDTNVPGEMVKVLKKFWKVVD